MVAVDAVFLIVVITGNRIIEVDIANDIHRKREAVELVVVTFIDQHIHDDRLAVSTEIRYRQSAVGKLPSNKLSVFYNIVLLENLRKGNYLRCFIASGISHFI